MGQDARRPESAQQWYERVLARAAAEGSADPEWPASPAYPLDEDGAVRPLEQPGDEPQRGGIDGVDCPMCERSHQDDRREYVYWRDELLNAKR